MSLGTGTTKAVMLEQLRRFVEKVMPAFKADGE